MDSVVLAVDGEEGVAGFFCGGHDQFASGDQDFFVGEGDGAAEFDGFVGSGEPNDTDGGGDHDFGVRVGGYSEHTFLAVLDGGCGDSLFFEKEGKFVDSFGVGYGDQFGTVAFDLGDELVEIGAGGQSLDFKLAGE